MAWFSGDRQRGESDADFQWRQEMADAADAVCDAADARGRGDYRRADDRSNYAENMLGHAEQARKRG